MRCVHLIFMQFIRHARFVQQAHGVRFPLRHLGFPTFAFAAHTRISGKVRRQIFAESIAEKVFLLKALRKTRKAGIISLYAE